MFEYLYTFKNYLIMALAKIINCVITLLRQKKPPQKAVAELKPAGI